MTFDESFLTRNFERFNREIFHNELPKVRFVSSRARTYAAQYNYQKRFMTNRTIPESRCIRYNISFSFPERVLEEILIHEMLHLYIEVKKLKDTSPHGRIFKALSAQIKEAYGYDISVSLKISPDSGGNTGEDTGNMVQDACKRQRHFFCLLEIDAEHYGICTVTQPALFDLWDKLGPAFHSKSWTWYVSFHPFFQSFPKSRGKLRYYTVDRAAIEPLRDGMRPLIRKGNRITWG